LGFGVWGLGFGLRVQEVRVQEFRVQGSGCRVHGLGVMV
jgi:hypothetical protein